MNIQILNSKDNFNEFYLNLAPLMLNRNVAKENGAPMYTQDDYVWFVAFSSSGEVMGFICCCVSSGVAQYKHEHTIPQYRGKGVYSALFQSRLQYLKDKHPDIKNAIGTFTKKGYEAIKNIPHIIVKEFTNYTKVEFEL